MKILVVVADCLTINSSANLCHLAYIKGMVDLGHSVELLCANEQGERVDLALKIPSAVKVISYSGKTRGIF